MYRYFFKYLDRIFWGIIFIILYIPIYGFDIVPDFIGYILIIDGLSSLYKDSGEKYFRRSKIFSIILLLLNIVTIFYSLNIFGSYRQIDLILVVLNLIFKLLVVFYMYSGIINILGEIQLTDSIVTSRKVFVYVTLFTSFFVTFSPNLGSGNIFVILLLIVNFILMIRWAHQIRKTRNYFFGR